MNYPDSLESLTLHTVPARYLYHESAGHQLAAGHIFQRIVGAEFSGNQIGNEGKKALELDVPLEWAERLGEFMVLHEATHAKDAKAKFNCHYFTSFMKLQKPSNHSPDKSLRSYGVLLDSSHELGFNELLILARYPGGNPNVVHSALSLGPQAPEKVIQVTAQDGVLAIDSIYKVLLQYKRKALYPPDWYRVSEPEQPL